MSHMDDFADGLKAEVLTEMAQNFFGARTEIDHETELFEEFGQKLLFRCEAALAEVALVHALLLDKQTVADFYALLGIDPDPMIVWVDTDKARLAVKRPFGLKKKARWVRLFFEAYQRAHHFIETYVQGHLETDQASGRKQRTMNYEALSTWCAELNARIDKLNTDHQPSCVMRLAHGLETGEVDKERVTGATLHDKDCTLDDSLKLPNVSCESLGLKAIPEWPPLEEVKARLKPFLRDLYAQRGEALEAAVDELDHHPG